MNRGLPKPRVTLREIARRANVSVACVSLALRNSPRISADRRERISRICLELGYVRDGRLCELMSHLRSLDRRPSGAALAAVVVSSETDAIRYRPVWERLLPAVSAAAREQGYALDVFDLEQEGLDERRWRHILHSRGIQGVVVLPGEAEARLTSLDAADLCVVVLGEETAWPALHRVCAHHLKMTDALLTAAWATGHRRIGFIPEAPAGHLRERLRMSSIDFHFATVPEAARVPPFQRELGDPLALRAWLRLHQPDLVVGSPRAYARLVEIGCAMPASFSFASWDITGLPLEVAGMDPRWDLIGREGVRRAVRALEGNELGPSAAPEMLLVDSGFRLGPSLAERSRNADAPRRLKRGG